METTKLQEGEGTYASLWRLSWPNFTSSALMPVSSVLSMMVIGRVSDTALAVVGLALAILFPLNTALARLLRSSTAAFAELHGKGESSRLVNQFWQVFWIGIAASIVLAGVFLVAPLSFKYIGVDAVIGHLTRIYLMTATLGIPAMGSILVFMAFLFGQGIVKPIMNITLIGVVLSPVLTWFFAFWDFGRPLGVLGYCVSTVIIQWISVILLSVVIRGRSAQQRTSLLRNIARPDLDVCRAIWKIGAPLAASSLIRLGGGAIVAVFVARSGASQMAAFQVANSTAEALMLPVGALGMSFVVLLGHSVAAVRQDHIRRVVFSAVTSSIFVAGIIAILMIAGRVEIVGLYSQDSVVKQIAARALFPVAIFLLAQTSVVLCESVLTVYRKTKLIPTIAMVSYAVIVIPLSILAENDGSSSAYHVRLYIAFGAIFTAISLAILSIKVVLTSSESYKKTSEGRIGVS